MKTFLRGVGLVFWLGVCACGSSNYLNVAPGAFGSCNSTTQSQCFDFVGLGASSTGNCATYGTSYTFATTACPTDSRVGSCTDPSLSGVTIVRNYSDGGAPFTTATAQSDCASLGGTFQPN